MVSGMFLALLAVPAIFLYPMTLDRYTYVPAGMEKTRHVCATSEYLTPRAQQYVRENPNDSSPAQLSRNFETAEMIWERPGREIAQQRLLGTYAWLVLALCSAILCFLEVISDGNMTSIATRQKRGAQRTGRPNEGRVVTRARTKDS